MRNKTLEAVVENVIKNSDLSKDAKSPFIAYVKNMFEGNAKDEDLKSILSMIDYKEEQ